MKSISMTFVLATVLSVGGCATANHSQVDNKKSAASIVQQQGYRRFESVAYDWEGYRIEVLFHKQARAAPWIMTVRDAWDIYDQLKEEGKVWGLSESKCSTEECLRMIDRSLSEFHTEKPDARLESVAVEMHVIRDLWREILAGASRRLSTLGGKKRQARSDVPSEIDDEIRQVFSKSPTTAAIKTLLRKHGIGVRGVDIAVQLLFKDSLAGRKWSEIANLPGVGVLVPGVVEFDLDESRMESATDVGGKGLTASQSAQR